MNEVSPQILKLRTFDPEGDTCSQMLKIADVCREACPRCQRLRCSLANRREPLARKMMKDRNMCLQKVAGRREVLLSQAVKRLDVTGLNMSGDDDWRQPHPVPSIGA